MNSLSFIGSHLLALAFPVSLYSILFYIIGSKKNKPAQILSAQRANQLSFFLITAATLLLVYAFLSHDYSLIYVYSYSNKSLPLFYKLTGLWAGLDGSILFWTWLMSLYTFLLLRQNKIKNADWMPYINATMLTVILFFLALMIFANNPFAPMIREVSDGKGLNPLLQNIAMVIHPPMLYLGFTGLSVPFAFIVAALITKRFDTTWIEDTRRWTLIAWFFLTAGLILGGAWAYVELGWGGFWAWDPVENAGLMPWLTATAYLHSVMIQKKRGMLMLWNVVLLSLTFLLTLFGTYLTRSGVVQSVHAFSESNLGPFFLAFIVLIIIFTLILIVSRLSILKSKNQVLSYFSKESAFIANNILFVAATFAVIWGTMFPTFSELLTGQRITVGIPFFNQVMAPIGVLLLFLMGVGPMISWKKSSIRNFNKNIALPLTLGLVLIPILYFTGFDDWYVATSGGMMLFVFATIFLEFYRGHRVMKKQYQLSFMASMMRLLIKSNRRYGGYIIHLGVLFIFLGIAGTVYQDEIDFTLSPGESIEFRDYTLSYLSPQVKEDEHKIELYANVAVSQDKELMTQLRPAKFFYKSAEQPSTEVSLYQTLFWDLYLIIGNLDTQTGRCDFRVTFNPLISYVWLGGFIILLGIVLVLLPSASATRQTSSWLLFFVLLSSLSISHPIQAETDPSLKIKQADHRQELHESDQDPLENLSLRDKTLELRLKEVTDKLICQCGGCVRMSLRSCNCDYADKERRVILGLFNQGQTNQSVIDTFIKKYGLSVLAAPPKKGFFNWAYWTPIVGLVFAFFLGIFLAKRFFKGQTKALQQPGRPTDDYSKKLLDELRNR